MGSLSKPSRRMRSCCCRQRRRNLILLPAAAALLLAISIISISLRHVVDGTSLSSSSSSSVGGNSSRSAASSPLSPHMGHHRSNHHRRRRMRSSRGGRRSVTTTRRSATIEATTNSRQLQFQQILGEDPSTTCYINTLTPTHTWHIDVTTKFTCTNNQQVPLGFHLDTMSHFFKGSCYECCEVMFGDGGCNCVDVCTTNEEEESTITSSTTTPTIPSSCLTDDNGNEDPCCNRYYHPDLTAQQTTTCINTYDTTGTLYPPFWNDTPDTPSMVGVTMFTSGEECCEKLTLTGGDDCLILVADDCFASTTTTTTSASTTTATSTTLATSTSTSTTTATTSTATTSTTTTTTKGDDMEENSVTLPPPQEEEEEEEEEEGETLVTPTPQPSIFLTIPPHLFLPTTSKPTSSPTTPQPSPGPTTHSAPTPHQDYCSKIVLRTKCINSVEPFNCKWSGSCVADISSVVVSTTTTTTTTTTTPAAACTTNGYQWHRDKSTQGATCTNNQDYPQVWDDPNLISKYLFDTPEECCLAHFTLETCTAIDACGAHHTLDMSFSKSESDITATSSSVTEEVSDSTSSSHCKDLGRRDCSYETNCKWTGYTTGCDDATTEEVCNSHRRESTCLRNTSCTWKEQPDSTLKCVAKPTAVDNTMVEASASISEDADCTKRRYHPKNILDKTCTNDESFPPTWGDEFFSSTAEECCNTHYGDTTSCKIVDVCSASTNQ